MDSVEPSTDSEEIEDETIDFVDLFNKQFPYFLSIGMTYEQYWQGDPYLTRFYREAEKMRFNRENQMMWIQGLYINNAVETVVYNAWCRKNGEKAITYYDKPIDFNVQKNIEDEKKEAEAQAEVWLTNLVNSYKR